MMSSSMKSTIKFALLAYSVYNWVDGSTRAQNNSSSEYSIDLRESESAPEHGPRGWKAVWEWMCRRGPSMNEEEQSALGKMNMVTAFLLFNGIHRLSFRSTSMQTPSLFLTSLPDARRLRWKLLILATAILSLMHETQRAALIYYLCRRRTNLTNKIKKDLANMRIGQVAVRGDSVTVQQQEGEEEEECLICSGSAETMSTSSRTDDSAIRMGPLEAFCTIAPQKHLAHRQCFLRWHAAYLQQSRHSLGAVNLIDDATSQTPLQQLFIRANIILQASGFDYLAPRLTRQTDPSENRDSLTIHTDTTQSTRLLATLRTSAPPCPGCRSPVCLRFIDSRPPSSSHTSDHAPPVQVTALRRIVFSGFWQAWARTVTGRTISAYFGSLLSFMVVLATITKVRDPALRISLQLGQ
ncbi:unnamed protein product [Rhizoctonia solani]|uniref:Uncharacterized protein n=1 Tax=Rhizoctonia solani TaxID=456999 RepID=A0A8H2X9M1_9AGAM|nr:unnamed protein product [Rhizoctonia solani]